MLFVDSRVLEAYLGSTPAEKLQTVTGRWGLTAPLHQGVPASVGRWRPPQGICTVCMRPAVGQHPPKVCQTCQRAAHPECAGTMGLSETGTWLCPTCITPTPASQTGCCMCPPAMQLECAVRVRTPRQVVGLSRWVHPFCGLALTVLRLTAPDKCCFCVNDTSARQWLRMQCGHANCDLVMHSACALREAARGNCEILVQAATTDQPGTYYHFGAPRQFIVRCPSHKGAQGAFRPMTIHPCGPFGAGFPTVSVCDNPTCDFRVTPAEGRQCSECFQHFCPACIPDDDSPARRCVTCGPPPSEV